MRIVRATVALVAVATFGSCTSVDGDGSATEASGLTSQQFSDVPVPDGMLLQTGLHESHSYESGRLRHGDLYYYGNLAVDEVCDYMKQRMPLHGWQLVDETGGATSELVFERAPNRARCSVWVDSSSVTRMHVEVRTPSGG